jgi:hypothetical protein
MNVNDLSLTIGEAGVPPCASTTNESRARRRRIRANPMQSAPTVYGWPLQARTNRLPAGQQAVRAGASQYHFLFSFRYRSFSACMITVHQRDNTPLLARTGFHVHYPICTISGETRRCNEREGDFATVTASWPRRRASHAARPLDLTGRHSGRHPTAPPHALRLRRD